MQHAPIRRGVQLNGIYEIDEPLAAGGMGEIYRGHAIQGGHPVAIKLIRDDLAHDDSALALFRREADALLSIHHEAIVRYFVFSMDPVLQRPYLAMEFVEGDPLSRLLKAGGLPLQTVLALKTRVASGLAAAHQRQIIHRDIAPDNIIIPEHDFAKARIIDFGIARSTRQGEATIIGTGVAGKYSYMSPEQLGLFGGEVGPASDVYSLGLVLAQACRGTPIDMRGPNGSPAEAIERRRVVPDLRDVYPELRPLLESMLQPDPSRRPGSMRDVEQWTPRARAASAESTVLQLSGREAQPPRAADTKSAGRSGGIAPLAAVGVGLVVIAALGGGAYLFLGRPNSAPPVAPQTAAPPGVAAAPAAAPIGGKAQGERPQGREQIASFLRSFNLGTCAAVTPVELASARVSLIGFGVSATPFENLDRAFKDALGFEPDIAFREVASLQCPAVDFVARARGVDSGSGEVRIDMKTSAISGDEPMSGAILTSAPNVELIVVDDEGKAYNATSVLRGDAPRRTFAMRLKQGSNSRVRRVALVAVASERPIDAVRTATRAPAAELFASAGNEIAGRADVKAALSVAELH